MNLKISSKNNSKVWALLIPLMLQWALTSSAQDQSNGTGEPERITDELLRLESIRLSNHQEFIQGISDLGSDLEKMSAYQICHFQFLQAYQLAFAGESQQAVSDLEKSVPLCDDLRAKIRMEALIANISAIGGDYTKASKFIDNAIQNADQIIDNKTKAIAYSGASSVYSLLDQKDLSVKYSELLYSTEVSDENLCKLHYSKNIYHLDGDQNQVDLADIDAMANQCRTSGNLLYAQSIVLDNVKRVIFTESLDVTTQNNITTVINDMITEMESTPYKNIKANFKAIQAQLAYLNDEFDEAKMYGEQSLELNKTLGYTEQLLMALKVLENISKNQGDYEQSYNYLSQRNKAELSMYDQSQAKQMAFMTVKHSNLAKVFEIEQLNQQKEVLELEKQLAQQETNNQRLIILLILVVLAFMLLLLLRIKKKHDYFKDVSEIDHLTKVLTRKAFEEQVNGLLTVSKGKKLPVHLAIMDLDFFKLVNDNHGHLIGDWVLKNVIYACKELVEEGMFIGRLGGEEFGVVMLAVEKDAMVAKIEAMRHAIEKLDTSSSGVSLPVTASFGISNTVESGYDLDMLLTHADLALFKAKNKGRNQSVFYQHHMS